MKLLGICVAGLSISFICGMWMGALLSQGVGYYPEEKELPLIVAEWSGPLVLDAERELQRELTSVPDLVPREAPEVAHTASSVELTEGSAMVEGGPPVRVDAAGLEAWLGGGGLEKWFEDGRGDAGLMRGDGVVLKALRDRVLVPEYRQWFWSQVLQRRLERDRAREGSLDIQGVWVPADRRYGIQVAELAVACSREK